MKTLKKEGRAFRNIGKNIYIFPTVKSALLLLFYSFTIASHDFRSSLRRKIGGALKATKSLKSYKKEEKCLLFLVLKYPHVSRYF